VPEHLLQQARLREADEQGSWPPEYPIEPEHTAVFAPPSELLRAARRIQAASGLPASEPVAAPLSEPAPADSSDSDSQTDEEVKADAGAAALHITPPELAQWRSGWYRNRTWLAVLVVVALTAALLVWGR